MENSSLGSGSSESVSQDDVSSAVDEVVRDVRRGAARALDAASRGASDAADALKPSIFDDLVGLADALRGGLRDREQWPEVARAARAFAADHPVATAGAAAVAGVLVARRLRRR